MFNPNLDHPLLQPCPRCNKAAEDCQGHPEALCVLCGSDHTDPDDEWACLGNQASLLGCDEKGDDKLGFAFQPEGLDDLVTFHPWRGF